MSLRQRDRFNCDPEGVMRCRVSVNIDVIIPRPGNFAAPAPAIVRLLPKLNSPVPVEVGQFAYEELGMTGAQLIVMLTSPRDLHSHYLAFAGANHITVM